MLQSQFKPGDPYTLCQRTGFKVRVSETVIEPTDLIRGKEDKQVYRGLISETGDHFLGVDDVTKDSF